MPQYDILSVIHPIVDRIIQVPEEFLEGVEGDRGGSSTLDIAIIDELVEKSGAKETLVPGGSASNTVKGLARFGRQGALIGKVGADGVRDRYLEGLEGLPVTPLFLNGKAPTAQVVIMVTPDGERTQRCYLGSAGELTPEEIDPAHFDDTRLLYIEGYTLYQEELPLRAIEIAKEKQIPIAIGLSSFEVVRDYKELILDLLTESVDIVISNRDEAKELCMLQPEPASRALSLLCRTAVVTDSENGCWVASGKEHFHCPTDTVQPVDGTGSGDLFTSGFLEGYLAGQSLEVSAKLGCLMGTEVVQVLGPNLPDERWESIHERYRSLNS